MIESLIYEGFFHTLHSLGVLICAAQMLIVDQSSGEGGLEGVLGGA